jgi:hypothetical protein
MLANFVKISKNICTPNVLNKLDTFLIEKSLLHPGIIRRRFKTAFVAYKIFLQDNVSFGKNQLTFLISFVEVEIYRSMC